MKLSTMVFSGIAVVTAGLTPAAAQQNGRAGINPQNNAAGGNTAAGGNSTWTTANVDTSRPFGSIDISKAGTTNQNMSSFMSGLSSSDRAELQGRCGVIDDPANSGRYQQDARSFCQAMNTSGGNAGGAGNVGGNAGGIGGAGGGAGR